eukprot:56164-Chlamydomonas_euryale.AAC.13
MTSTAPTPHKPSQHNTKTNDLHRTNPTQTKPARLACGDPQEVPAEVPEPTLGVNFTRDGMERRDWLGLVALHSDAWLMACAAYRGARFDAEER